MLESVSARSRATLEKPSADRDCAGGKSNVFH